MLLELPDPNNLPEDPEQLRALVCELRRTILVLANEINGLKQQMKKHKSERISSKQLLGQLLLFEELADLAAEIEAQLRAEAEAERARKESGDSDSGEPGKKKRKPKRAPLPTNLPRQKQVHNPPAEELNCLGCGGQLQPIGVERSEQLELLPPQFIVIDHERPKYACPCCRTNVVVAAAPDKPIAKGIPGPGLLTHIILSKFCDHLPLYRQAAMFGRQGVRLARSTMTGWVAYVAAMLSPIVGVMRADLLKSRIIHTDDTSVAVQVKHSKSETGYVRLWPYLGDADHPHLVFDFTTSRRRDGPAQFLGDYEGYLQADAYAGYDRIYASGKVTEVACWAHARRKFKDAQETSPKESSALLALIKKLYRIEDAGQELTAPERAQLRQREATPILDQIQVLLHRYEPLALPKGPLRKAIRYALNQWKALTRYVEDGALAIDNNAAERSIRPVAVGRKNWLFFGSDVAGEDAAVLFSLIGSCKHIGIDPAAYLRDVIMRVGSQPADRMWELTPLAWKLEREANGDADADARVSPPAEPTAPPASLSPA